MVCHARRDPPSSLFFHRISLERLPMSAEVTSAAGAAGNRFRIGARRRRLSRILSDVYSQLNNVTPRHECKANEDYLKRIFAIVNSEGRRKVSTIQLLTMRFNDASRTSTAMMMAAADHGKDGYLTESEFVSSLVHVESGADLLQVDCNKSKLPKLSSSSENDDAVLDSLAGHSTQEKSQNDAHLLKTLGNIRMRGVEVTSLCSQSSRSKCIATSPDGNLYAVAHRYDNVAHVYMISNGAEVCRLAGHQGSLLGILLSRSKAHCDGSARQLHGLPGSHDRTGVPLLRAPGNRHGSCGEPQGQVCLQRVSG
ncbi:hypothetical protein, unknown function [Leishmania mexicana MHOM/GT/2001/U1103]|uniref:EF-hand domain-containing protein n=1 Tax=Leishmania mexicana (strain MHOM/GT/2001/U1103) TaxID=929439 RepID=E9AYD8_LEIMU|nr:hypothetical protein, unknown function [Leishmania mexicana MHOM/GT/2001/U1103]CBZ27979.1 hypothetical protein, unknown function [Leishmania mexicana MHOM/GT/2001/U1103]